MAKEKTILEYHSSINRVIDYINKNLHNNMSTEILAGIANISEFHFHRIFKAIIGENIASYITRLRLEKAAQRLIITNQPISVIANSSGYSNSQALSKAFKRHYGISPSDYRSKQAKVRNHNIKHTSEDAILKPDIRDIDPKKLIYIRVTAKYGDAYKYKNAWRELINYARDNELLSQDCEYLGLNYDNPDITNNDLCRFYACVTIKKDFKPGGKFGILNISGGKYSVFTLRGPYDGLYNLYDSIYNSWLPDSGFRLRNSIPFEKYLNDPNKVLSNDLLTEIYLPIK